MVHGILTDPDSGDGRSLLTPKRRAGIDNSRDIIGWGLFNLVEGVVDHHILTIHHVRESNDQTA